MSASPARRKRAIYLSIYLYRAAAGADERAQPVPARAGAVAGNGVQVAATHWLLPKPAGSFEGMDVMGGAGYKKCSLEVGVEHSDWTQCSPKGCSQSVSSDQTSRLPYPATV
jgi:hypothetical protein